MSATANPDRKKEAVMLADELIEIATALCALLGRENERLARRNVAEAKELQEEKDRLSRLYAHHMQALVEQPDLLKEAPEDRRRNLGHLAVMLERLLERNATLLNTALESSHRLLDAIVAAVNRHDRSQAPAYGRQGALETAAGAAGRRAMAINGTF